MGPPGPLLLYYAVSVCWKLMRRRLEPHIFSMHAESRWGVMSSMRKEGGLAKGLGRAGIVFVLTFCIYGSSDTDM